MQTLAYAADFDAEHGPKLGQALAQAETRAERGNSHEILLSVRQGIGGRSALLYKVRADVRREALSPVAPEFSLRHGLLPVRLARTLPGAAIGFLLVEDLGISRKDRLRDRARLSHSHRLRSDPEDARVPECAHRLRDSNRLAVVALELASRMVSQNHPMVS